MQAIFYTEFSKKHNSTRNPDTSGSISVSVTKDVKLKDTCDIIHPKFFVADTSRYYYCKVFGFYYFIDKEAYDINGAHYIECTIDVLGTWRDAIHASTFFVDRCADSRYYNVDINDDALSVEDMVSYTSSASTYCNIAPDLLYIVRMYGRETTGGIGTFVMNRFALQNIFSQMWIDIDHGLGLGDLEEFMQMWLANPAQFIIGVYSSPIGASVYANNVTNSQVFIGGHETNLYLDKITRGDVVIAQDLPISKPTSHYNDFRKTDSAFSNYTIYIPTVGTVGLSPDLMDVNLTMDIGGDLFSGDLLFTLKAGGDAVASYSSNCYASQSIGVANQAASVVSSAIQTTNSIMTGNVGGIINGIKSGMVQSPSVVGSQGGTGCVPTANEIVITCVQKASAEFPLADYGRPCCKNLQLGLLSGFVRCGNPSINISAPDVVRGMINDLLSKGVFIE